MPRSSHKCMNSYSLGTTVIPLLKTRKQVECASSDLLTGKQSYDNMKSDLLSRLARIDIKRRAWGPQMLRENVHPHLQLALQGQYKTDTIVKHTKRLSKVLTCCWSTLRSCASQTSGHTLWPITTIASFQPIKSKTTTKHNFTCARFSCT